MIKCCFAVILLTLFSGTCAIADDYLLRVETVGLGGLPKGDQESDSKEPESIEIVVRKNNAFYGSTTIGVDKTSIRGMIRESDGGKLRIEIHFKKSWETGEVIPRVDGKKHPIRAKLYLNQNLDLIELGKPVVLDEPLFNSKRERLALLIDNFDPSIKGEE